MSPRRAAPTGEMPAVATGPDDEVPAAWTADQPPSVAGQPPWVAGQPTPGPEEPGSGGPPAGRLRRAWRKTASQGGPRRELDLRNTWQILAGAILLPLGVAAILLGWHGAAHGRVDQQQIPYLISGGVLGLAAVMVGCFFYWAHWLYRIYDQADLHHAQAMREQAELFRSLIEALGGQQPVRERDDRVLSHNGDAPSFVATPTGTNFHRPGCSIIANRQSTVRAVAADEVARMRPCRVCEPLATD